MIKTTNIWVSIIFTFFLISYSICATSQKLNVLYSWDKNLMIKSFDVSNDGQKTAMAIYPYHETIVYNTITGNELMRLDGEESTPKNVYIDDHTNNIIVEYFNSIYIWDLVDYSLKARYEIVPMTNLSFCKTTGQIAYINYQNEVIVQDIVTGSNTSFPLKGNFKFSDEIKFSPNGQRLYILSDDKLIAYESKDYKNQIKIESRGAIDYVVTNNTIITRYTDKNYTSSRVAIQYFELNGEASSEKIRPKNAYDTQGHMQPLNDNTLLYSSFNKIDMISKNGSEYNFSFKDDITDFIFNKSIGFVINYGKRLEFLDTEGRLISKIFAKSYYHIALHLASNALTSCLLAEDQIIFGTDPEKQPNVIKQETGFVNRFSGDEELFAFGTRDNKIMVWDMEKEKEIASISTSGGYPQFLNISHSNKIAVAIFSDNNIIRVYDITRKELIQELSFDNGIPSAMDFKNNWLVVGNNKGIYSVWKLENSRFTPTRTLDTAYSNTPITSIVIKDNYAYFGSIGRMYRLSLEPENEVSSNLIIGHDSYIHAMAFDSTGKFLVSSSIEGRTNLWDIENGHLLESIKIDSGWINNISLYDSLVIVANGPGLIGATFFNPTVYQQLQNPNPKLLIQSSNASSVRQITFSPNGKLLANIDGDRVKVRDVQTGFMISEFTTKDNNVNDIEFDNKGKSIIVASGKGLEYFDPVTGKSKKYIDLSLNGRSIHEVEVFPNRNIIIAINHHGWHRPLFFHQNSGQSFGTFAYNRKSEKDKFLLNMKISANEKLIATYGSHYIKIFEIDDKFSFNQIIAIPRPNPEISNEYWIDLMDFSKDGRYLSFVEFGSPNNVIVYDIIKKEIVHRQHGKLSKFGKNDQLLYMSSNTTLELLEIQSGKIKKFNSEKPHNNLIQALAYNSIFGLFASSDTWGNQKIWNRDDGRALTEVERFDNDTYNVELSPNGDFLAYNNKKGIFLFDLKRAKTINLDGTNYPYFGAFSPDNKYFYFRKDEDYRVFNLMDHTQIQLFNTGISKKSAGSTALSNDGNILLFKNKTENEYMVYDLRDKALITSFSDNSIGGFDVFSIQGFSGQNNTKLIGVGIKRENDKLLTYTLIEYDLKSKKHKKLSHKVSQKIEDLDGWDGHSLRYNARIKLISPDMKLFAYLEDYHLIVENLESNEILYDKYSSNLRTADFTLDSKYLILAYESGQIKVLNTSNFEEEKTFTGVYGDISSLSVRGRYVKVVGINDEINIFDIDNDYSKVYTCAFIGEGEFVIAIDEGYYYASKGASKSVAFKKGVEVFPFEQYDLFYNRPDIVLNKIGKADVSLVEAYGQAYNKRLKNMGFTEDMLKNDFHLPEIKIDNFDDIPTVVNSSEINLKLNMSDAKHKLDRINIWINDVAIFGSAGISLRKLNVHEYQTKLYVDLANGKNKVQVSVLNQAGAESFKETFEIECTIGKSKPDLYVEVISVSNYQQSEMNLKYAVKDGRDIANLYAQNSNNTYGNVYIDTLFNTDATLDNVLAIKEKLLKSNVDDQVILYVSGHGLLDDNLDFYFASHDMDFSNPALRGISYETLEGLLDSIPARKKLFMMDACHSGEVDKEDLTETIDTTLLLADGTKSGVKSYSYKGAKVLTSGNETNKLGLQNSFKLMQELFTNLNRGSGAMVISAAGGDSYALESNEWNNGVFTFAVINGLKNKAADKDNDGEITVSELRSYVIEQVQELTNGRQKPTSRQENVEFDFRVW